MSSFDIYDKNGNPITMAEFHELKFGGDQEYHRVGSTDIGPYWVSTVWLGMDHRFIGEGPPIIFETMVFLKGDRDDPEHRGLADMDCVRYCTEEEALAGHEAMCLLVEATLQETMEGMDDGPNQGGQGGSDQDLDQEPEEAPETLPGSPEGVPGEDDPGAGSRSRRSQERRSYPPRVLFAGP